MLCLPVLSHFHIYILISFILRPALGKIPSHLENVAIRAGKTVVDPAPDTDLYLAILDSCHDHHNQYYSAARSHRLRRRVLAQQLVAEEPPKGQREDENINLEDSVQSPEVSPSLVNQYPQTNALAEGYYDPTTLVLQLRIQTQGLPRVTAVHLHGAVDATISPLPSITDISSLPSAPLTPRHRLLTRPTVRDSFWREIRLTPSEAMELYRGELYLDIHTPTKPKGAIRGYLTCAVAGGKCARPFSDSFPYPSTDNEVENLSGGTEQQPVSLFSVQQSAMEPPAVFRASSCDAQNPLPEWLLKYSRNKLG